jgi:hypothetical protein
MDYFELAKNLVRMNEEWIHGHMAPGAIERLPQTHLSLLLRALRPQDKGVSGDAGVSLLLRRL